MKVESYKIKGWKQKETGLLISENENWILTKNIPNNYEVDGFKLFLKKYIKRRESNTKERKIEKVLKLKNISLLKPDDFVFGTALDLLKWVEQKFGLFEFQIKDEDVLFYGKINNIQQNLLKIDEIRTTGRIKKNYHYKFKIDKIRSITFMSDYFESIRLLMEDKLKRKSSNCE